MNIYSGFYCFLRRGQIQNTAATELSTAKKLATTVKTTENTENAQPTEPARRPARARIISQARPVTNARKNTTSMMQAQNVSKTATRHADRQASSSIRQATATATTPATKEYAHAIHAG
jgi:hypothetical protein